MQNSKSALLSSPNLLCHEESQSILNDVDTDDDYLSIAEDEDQYIEMLLHKEIHSNGRQKQQECAYVTSGNWIKEARLDAIQYILNTSSSFGFKIQTAYLAATYLHKFLSTRLIEGEKFWAIHLLAVACLSLAAKMEECRVPFLSEFPGDAYNFESKVIRRMELLILDTLDWRMEIAIPFTFINYFVSKFCENNQVRDRKSRVIEIISVAIKSQSFLATNANLFHDGPSTIAAAATLLILDPRLTRDSLELKINALSTSGLLKIEDIISFYNQMKELDSGRFKLSNSMVSPFLSPIQMQRTTGALENSSLTTGVSAKRKSLTFTDKGDENIKMPDYKRPC